jgi:hypothetical protein
MTLHRVHSTHIDMSITSINIATLKVQLEVVARHALNHLLRFIRSSIHRLSSHLLAFQLFILARNVIERLGLLFERILNFALLVLQLIDPAPRVYIAGQLITFTFKYQVSVPLSAS